MVLPFPTTSNSKTSYLSSGPVTIPSPDESHAIDSSTPALQATSIPPQNSPVAVSTAAPALKVINQAHTTLNSMQQGAQQQSVKIAAAKEAQQKLAADAAKTNTNQKLAAALTPPGVVLPPKNPAAPIVPATPTTPTTGNANADKFIADINAVKTPVAPTNLDTFGNEIAVPAGLTADDSARYITDYTKNQKDYADSMTKINDSLTQVENGTFPLTQGQQGQLDTTKQIFAQTQTMLDAANKNGTEAAIALGFRGGESPTAIFNRVQNVITQTAFAMTDNQVKMAKSVADLEEAFRKDDIENITALSKNLTDTYNAQSTYLDKMLNAAQTAQRDVNTYNLAIKTAKSKAAEDTFNNAMASSTFDLNKADKAFQAYIAQGNLTEEQKRDAETKLHDRISEGIESARVNLEKDKFLFDSGQADYWSKLNDVKKIPGVVADPTLGIIYFDKNKPPANLVPSAQNVANKNGVGIPDDPKLVQTVSTVSSNLKSLSATLQGMNMQNFVGAGFSDQLHSLIKGIHDSLQTASSGNNALVDSNLKLADDALSGKFGEIPVFMRSPAALEKQVAHAQQYLTNALHASMPMQYTSTQAFLDDNPINGNDVYAKAKTFALQQDPTATDAVLDADILQLVNAQ